MDENTWKLTTTAKPKIFIRYSSSKIICHVLWCTVFIVGATPYLQWNPSIVATIGNAIFKGVALSRVRILGLGEVAVVVGCPSHQGWPL